MTKRRSSNDSLEVEFEWDSDKNKANIDKYGLSFDYIIRAFSEPMLKRLDDRRDYGEERWIALGKIDGLVIVVFYTDRAGRVRIISARKANANGRKNGRKAYAQACEVEVSGH